MHFISHEHFFYVSSDHIFTSHITSSKGVTVTFLQKASKIQSKRADTSKFALLDLRPISLHNFYVPLSTQFFMTEQVLVHHRHTKKSKISPHDFESQKQVS